MNQTHVNAVEMVRAIRDAIYEETKSLSREELKEFFARESTAFREERHLSPLNTEQAPARKAPEHNGCWVQELEADPEV